ncbi:MAG: hypothetical protein ACKOW9_05480, partial [Candidatus Paceibacterota bacterium]
SFSDVCAATTSGTVISATETCRGNAAWPSVAQEISVSIKFSEPVTVTGSPVVRIIRANGADGVLMNYVSGSGTNTLRFRYIVPDPLPANFSYVKEDFEGDYAFNLPLPAGASIKTASGANVNLDGRWTAPPGNLCPIPDAPTYNPSDVALLTCFTKKVTGNSGNKVATFTLGTDKPVVVTGIPQLKAWSLNANPPAQLVASYSTGAFPATKLKFTAYQSAQSVPDESFDFVNVNNQFQWYFPPSVSIKTLASDGLQTYPNGLAPGTPGLPECAE